MRAEKNPIHFDTMYIPEPMSGCWLWLGKGPKNDNYCSFEGELVHHHGHDVPPGYVVHHTCGTKCCVNPAHHKLMTRVAHTRLHMTFTHCINGHEMTRQNRSIRISGGTYCLVCQREKRAKARLRKDLLGW